MATEIWNFLSLEFWAFTRQSTLLPDEPQNNIQRISSSQLDATAKQYFDVTTSNLWQFQIAENTPFGFNEKFYDTKYADIANAIDSGVFLSGGVHYALYGLAEGRSPNAAYDQAYYLDSNPDVAEAVNAGIMTGYEHFVTYGQFEGRQGSAAFNADAYLAANPDVAEAVHAGYLATAFQHYAAYGQYEDRPLAVAVAGVAEQVADAAV